MRRAYIIVAGLVGCGRLGFEPRVGPSFGGDDGVDAGPTPLACSQAAEICNGIDDDCNGVIDDGCPCAPLATTVNETPSAYTAQVAWIGDTLFMLQGDAATIAMWPIDAAGTLGTHVPIYSGAVGSTSGDGTFAWSGRTLGIAFEHDNNIIEFEAYDPVTKSGTPSRIDTTYPGASQHVAWAADHFVVAWQTINDDIVTREFSATGTPNGPEKIIAPATAGILGSIWVSTTGTIACVRDRMNATARVILIDTAGAVHTQPLPIGTGMACELLPIPGGYLAWYHSPTTNPVPLVFLDPSGATVATATLPANSYNDVAIQLLPHGFWVLASRSPGLYMHAVDELGLDAHAAVTSGPTQLDSLSIYLWSPPRLVTTATRALSSYSTNAGGAPSAYRLTQSCGP